MLWCLHLRIYSEVLSCNSVLRYFVLAYGPIGDNFNGVSGQKLMMH